MPALTVLLADDIIKFKKLIKYSCQRRSQRSYWVDKSCDVYGRIRRHKMVLLRDHQWCSHQVGGLYMHSCGTDLCRVKIT